MSTPEAKAKGKFKQAMKALADSGLPMKLEFHAGSPYGAASVDVTGVINGRGVAVELKRFDGKGTLTARQIATLNEFTAAGAHTAVVDSPESLAKFVAFAETLRSVAAPMYAIMTPAELVAQAQMYATTELERVLAQHLDKLLEYCDNVRAAAERYPECRAMLEEWGL